MRRLLTVLLLGVSGMPGTNAMSAPEAGCARLADLVFHAVLQDALPGRVSFLAAQHGVEECADTAATVSRAFTSAMGRIGISLAWGQQASAFCRTRNLSSCVPNRHPGADSGLTDEAQFVANSWRAVQWSVAARLLHGADVDHSRFDVAGLQRSLGIAFSPGATMPGARSP